jgi:hypothetical protein
MEQAIFRTIIEMANEMEKAEQKKQANTRLFDQVKEAFQNALVPWEEVDTYTDEEECVEHDIEIDVEHPYITYLSVNMERWTPDAHLDYIVVRVNINTIYSREEVDHTLEFYLDDGFEQGMIEIEAYVAFHTHHLLDSVDKKYTALMKASPVIRSEIDRLLKIVNIQVEQQEQQQQERLSSGRAGSIHYRKDVLQKWFFDQFFTVNPHISWDDVSIILDKSYPDIIIPYR